VGVEVVFDVVEEVFELGSGIDVEDVVFVPETGPGIVMELDVDVGSTDETGVVVVADDTGVVVVADDTGVVVVADDTGVVVVADDTGVVVVADDTGVVVVDDDTGVVDVTLVAKAAPGVRYQFVSGSWRHSPAVTPFQPLAWINP